MEILISYGVPIELLTYIQIWLLEQQQINIIVTTTVIGALFVGYLFFRKPRNRAITKRKLYNLAKKWASNFPQLKTGFPQFKFPIPPKWF